MSEFTCRWCGASFYSYKEWESHEDLHLDLDNLGGHMDVSVACRWCTAVFPSVSQLFEHEEIHQHLDELNDTSSIFNDCCWCGASFRVQSEFDDHVRIHKDLDDLNGTCPPRKRQKITHECQSPLPGSSHEYADLVDSSVSPGPSHSNIPTLSIQTGGQLENNDSLSYEIKKIGEKTFKNKVIDRHYRVNFDPNQALQGEKFSDLHDELENMFDDVLHEAKDHLQGNDLIRVIIHHDKLTNPIYVPLRPLDDMKGKDVMEHVENVLTSHEDLAMDEGFHVDVGTMELPKGGRGDSINNLTGPDNSIIKKSSILKVNNTDDLCLAHALIIGFLHARRLSLLEWKERAGVNDLLMEELVLKHKSCPDWYFKMIIKPANIKRQTDLVLKLCQLANIPTYRFLTINDIKLFEDILDVDVLVVSARMGNKFIKVPPEGSTRKRVYLYLVDDSHFHTIINICGFFGESKFCETCLKPYRNKHDCTVTCYVCNKKGCTLQDNGCSCRKCHVTCRSVECFNRHLQKIQNRNGEHHSMCEKYWKCTQCKKLLKVKDRKPEDHFCGEYQCQTCKQYVDTDHLCYIRSLDPKKSIGKFIFFDIECTQENISTCKSGYMPKRNPHCEKCKDKSNSCASCSLCCNCEESSCGKPEHKPNLIIAQKVCPSCINETFTEHSKCEDCGMRCSNCNIYNKEDRCYEKTPCMETCGFREVIFQGDNCSNEFGQWLFSKTHKDFTVLAHNMRSYDGYFLLDYLINQSIRPEVIYTGSKLMYVHITAGLNIRIIDSLNFLPMPLKAFPDAFELTELKKGYFPHFFNKKENSHYRGPYPDPTHYGMNVMDTDERQKFLEWHKNKIEENTVFDFKTEIIEYCRSDVDILRQACLRFRQLLMDITGKEETFVDDSGEPCSEVTKAVDPFNEVTIAAVCSKVYRTKFLKEDWEVQLRSDGILSDWVPAEKVDGQYKAVWHGEWLTETELQERDLVIENSRFVSSPIAQVPSNGYSTDQYSQKSIKWLEWVMEESRQRGSSIYIQHALNDGEFKIPGTRMKADGYCAETNTIYEFHGCLYHGCALCYGGKMQYTKFPRTKQSLHELNVLTFRKKKKLKSKGYKYVYIWEHEFNDLLKNNTTARSFVDALDIQERLKCRDSFFGGRVNGIHLNRHVQGNEKIKYADFCSLYPSVNKYAQYPLKEPKIITRDFADIEQYFGIAKVKVLPPRKLFFPVLPNKINNKLMFTLCRKCAEAENQDSCNCSDDERAMLGTWCTPELIKAKEKGYKILKIYEVYHWDETTKYNPDTGDGGIFVNYINLFLKIKQESSGWPNWVKTEEDAVIYLDNYLKNEGILLSRDKIRKNKALRSLAKLLLNSFWGKFGQRLNMPQTTFYHENEADKFFQLLSDPKRSVKDFHIVSRDTIQVTWENKDDFMEESLQTNIFVATFTTCWARLKLYDVLDLLQERVLYHDTDSVIYVTRPGEPEPQMGDYLGELTSELSENDHIVHFVSTGPKSYAYKTYQDVQCCKIRGFTLNYANKKLLNFDSMLELLQEKSSNTISVINPNKICRNKRNRKIYNRQEEKKFKIVYTKRVIQKDSFKTLPYGY